MWRSNPFSTTNWARVAPFILGGLLVPARALAEEPVELEWNVPAGCPTAARVSERIRKLAGPIKSTSTPLRAEATVTRRDDGKLHLHLVVHAGDAVGARDVDAKSCDDLAGVAAVALALLLRSSEPLAAKDLSAAPEDVTPIDGSGSKTTPDSATNGVGSENAPSSTAPANPTPHPSEENPRARENEPPSTPRNWHLLLRAPEAAVGIGLLPDPTFGVMAGFGVQLSRLSILAEGTFWHAESTQSPDDPGFGATVARKSASLDLCYALGSERWAIAPCALVGLEHVSVRGTGRYVAANTASTTWLAPGLGLEFRFRLESWLALVATADARVETARPKLLIAPTSGYEAVTPGPWQPAPVAAALSAGPQFIW